MGSVRIGDDPGTALFLDPAALWGSTLATQPNSGSLSALGRGCLRHLTLLPMSEGWICAITEWTLTLAHS